MHSQRWLKTSTSYNFKKLKKVLDNFNYLKYNTDKLRGADGIAVKLLCKQSAKLSDSIVTRKPSTVPWKKNKSLSADTDKVSTLKSLYVVKTFP